MTPIPPNLRHERKFVVEGFSVSTAAPVVIIELKFGTELADDAAQLTGSLPFRLTRFPKYVAGMEQI